MESNTISPYNLWFVAGCEMSLSVSDGTSFGAKDVEPQGFKSKQTKDPTGGILKASISRRIDDRCQHVICRSACVES